MCVACVQNVIYAEAIFDYQGNDNEELSFHAGDLIEVSDTSHKQWWWGTIKATTLSSKTSQPKSNTTATPCDEIRHGWIPASYVRVSRSILILNRFVERFLYGLFSERHCATVEELHKGEYEIPGGGCIPLEILDTSGKYSVN